MVGRKFVLQLAKGEDGDIFSDISQLREGKLVYLKLVRKGFSKMSDDPKWKEIVKVPSDFPELSVDEVTLTKEELFVFNDLQRRIVYFDQAETSEYTMREFISPILLGALAIYDALNPKKDDLLQLVCEKKVSGEIGTGPVDYVVTYRKMNIVLTEAKREKILSGIQQNIRQQEASRQQYVRELASKINQPGSVR